MSTRRRARCEALSPELLFLDIQMPGGSGFDLLTRLDYLPQVVFTTAHDEHAVRAFEINALDYVLKPIDPERLAAAVSRVKAAPAVSQPDAALEQIFVKDGPRCWFVPLREVRLLTSEGNYVRLSWGNKRPLLGRALVGLEQRLDPKRFFRANRRQILNLDFIEGVEPGVGGPPARAAARWSRGGDLPAPGAAVQDANRRLMDEVTTGRDAVRGRGVGAPRPRSVRSARSGRAQSCAAAARPPLR